MNAADQVAELEGEASAAGAHLDAIAVDDWTAGEDAEQAQVGPDYAPDGFLTREMFREGFGLTFRLVGAITSLDAIKNAPDRPEASPAADVVYDIARETPWLHFLIQPSNVWLQRAIVLGAFALPVAVETAHELRARRAKPVNPDQGERDQAAT